MNCKKSLLLFLSCCSAGVPLAQNIQNNPNSNHGNKFEALGTILPTPNEYRTASGAPGPKYWQQRCDYEIKANLDEDKQWLTGTETITYYNNSPNELTYLWMQLDENEHSNKNNANYQDGAPMRKIASDLAVDAMSRQNQPNDFGDNITKLTDVLGKSL